MKVLVVGGQGYIGSRLVQLMHTLQWDVHSVDLCWFGSANTANIAVDYCALRKDFLAAFEAIVVLAGHSSVAMCAGQPLAAFTNNVVNLLTLVEQLAPEQKLIYLSSGSVYGSTASALAIETDVVGVPLNEYDASKRSLDWAMLGQHRHQKWWGLRCATVSGLSPQLRLDLMANAMYDTAVRTGKVVVYGAELHRPVVSIRDLTHAIVWLLETGRGGGLYNIRSFNTTNIAVGRTVSEHVRVPLSFSADLGNPYDFWIDDTKLRKLGFECSDSLEDILMDLDTGFTTVQKADRRQARPYP